MNIATAYVQIRPETSGFEGALKRGIDSPVQQSARKLRGEFERESTVAGKNAAENFRRPFTGMASGLGGLIAKIGFAKVLKDSSSAAANLEDEVSKSVAVFGDLSTEVQTFAKTTKDSLGISERAALNATGTYGGLFTSMGIGQREAADMSVEMTKLAGDMASFNGRPVEEALNAIRAGLVGETEPLKTFQVLLDDVSLKQKAMALGLTETTTGVLPPAIRSQAAYALILERSKNQTGDFARTQDNAANQMKISKAAAEEAAASLGTSLLPIVTKLAGGVTIMADGFAKLPGPLKLATVAGLGFLVFGSQLRGIAHNVNLLTGAIGAMPAKFTQARTSGAGFASSLLGSAGLSVGLGAVTAALGIGVTAYTLWSQQKQKARAETISFADALLREQGILKGTAQELLQNDLTQKNQIDNLVEAKVSVDELSAALTKGADAQTKEALAARKANGVHLGFTESNELLAESLKGTDDELGKIILSLQQSGQLDQGMLQTINEYIKKMDEAAAINKDKLAAGFNDAEGAAAELGSEIDATGKAAEDAAEAFKNLADATVASFTSGRDYQGALRDIERANLAVVAVQNEGSGSAKSQADAQEEAAEAAERLANAQEAVGDAEDRVIDAQQSIIDAAQRRKDAEDGIAEAALRRVDAEEGVAEAAKRTGEAEANLKQRTNDVAKAKDELTRVLQGYGKASREAKEATEALDDALRDQRGSELDVADAKDAVIQRQQEAADAQALYGEGSKEAKKASRDLERAQLALEGAQDRLQETSKEAKDAQKELNEVTNGASKNSERAKTASEKLADAQNARKEASNALKEAEKGEEQAARAVTEAAKGQAQAQRSLQEAVRGQESAAKGLTEAEKGVIDAIQNVATVQRKNAKPAMDSYGGSTKSAAEKALDMKDALDAQADAYEAAAEQAGITKLEQQQYAAALRGEVIPAQRAEQLKLQGQLSEYKRLRDTLAPGSELRKNIEEHIAKLEATPGVVTTDLKVVVGEFATGVKNLFGGIAESFGKLFNPIAALLPGAPQINIGGIVDSIKNLIPGFHTGGVMPGRPGSEGLALLKAGERVLPPGAQTTNSSRVYNLNIQTPQVSMSSIVEGINTMEYLYG